MLKADINRDLKTAMLARDKRLVSILRSLKGAILNREIEQGKRDEGLEEAELIKVLKKERKSRRDSVEIYNKANEIDRAQEESYQIEVIEKYLPAELSKEEVVSIVDKVLSELNLTDIEMKDMGRIIGAVKKHNNSVDGAVLAEIVKGKVTK